MKKYLHILSAFSLLCATAYAQQKDTIYITDFGATPYSYENCVTQIQAAIDECKRTGAKVLSLPNGRYDIWPEGATRKEYFISNTSTEQECPSKVKTVGLMLDKINDLTIEGNGATLMYHGKMTTLALEHCSHIRINNLHIDFERPAGSEVQYKKVTEGETEVSVHPDTRYEIVNGKSTCMAKDGVQTRIIASNTTRIRNLSHTAKDGIYWQTLPPKRFLPESFVLQPRQDSRLKWEIR